VNHPVKVISLARSLERRKTFSELNAHIDFEFFDAIEGAQIMPELNSSPDLFEPGLRYNAGAVGCAMSHLMLWQEAAETGRVLTIVEDDAILRHDFHEQAARAIERLPQDWDIVMWAWNFDSILSLNVMPDVSQAVMLFDQGRMRESIAGFQTTTKEPWLLPLDKCFGTPAYAISPMGARKFMLNCFPLKNFQLHFPVLNRTIPNNGIDIAMNRIYSATGSFCALPPLAVTKNEHAASLIQQDR
jgi:GR25 family glycosyltransferase involved in LPS biosynthesis